MRARRLIALALVLVLPIATVVGVEWHLRATAAHGFDWGNFADGTITGEGIVDQTQNWNSDHVKLLLGKGPNGGNAVLVTATDDTTLPNLDVGGVKMVRVHGFRNTQLDVHTRWFGSTHPHQIARAISVQVPQGFDLNTTAVTTDEIHGDNGTGSAPFNLQYQVGQGFTLLIRGSDSSSAGLSTGYPFDQNVFGTSHDATTNGPDYRHAFDWSGGNKPVVVGQWVDFRLWWHDYSTDPNKGAFTAWARWGDMHAWRKIADISHIRTAYPDIDGDVQSGYPMLSLYYAVGSGHQQAAMYAAGRIEPSLSTLESWQDQRLGFAR